MSHLSTSLLLLLACLASAFGQPQYDYIDLTATYGDYSYSGINDHGVIIGTDPNGPPGYGFYIDLGGLHYLPESSPGSAFLPKAINNNGDIIGWGKPQGSSTFHSYLYSNGTVTDLNIPGASFIGAVKDINDLGVIVGDNPSQGGFRWQNGQLTYLTGTLPAAVAINNSGQIGGTTSPMFGTYTATRWDGDTYTELSPPSSEGDSIVRDINDSGACVGELDVPPSWRRRAALWQPDGQVLDLGDFAGGTSDGFCSARSINSSTQVVGWSTDANAVSFGFLWEQNSLYRLQDLLPSGHGWYVTLAQTVNDRGQIIARGYRNGANSTLLLAPVPEVGTCCTLLGLLIFRRAAKLIFRNR